MSRRSHKTAHGLVLGLLLCGLPLVGCSGDDGAPGTSTGGVTGTVTNNANGGAPVANATILTTPAVAGSTITTNASGVYSAQLPVGNYTLEVDADNFESQTASVSVLAGVNQTVDFALDPTSNVVVDISGGPGTSTPGATFDLTANVTAMDGSTVQSYSWTQTMSAPATIQNGDQQTATITLGDAAAYKQALLDHLPVVDRFAVQPVDPLAMEEGGMVAFECEVTTTSGTYHAEVEVLATVDFAAWATGLRNVPVGVPVLLSGKDQATYDWALSGPAGTASALTDETTRFPYFTPDVTGTYTVTVTDLSGPSTVTLTIYAGEWQGGINGKDANGRPTTICATSCHATVHNQKFVDWAETGHAEIFTNNVNEGGHYGPSCFPCHTVGYNTTADNGGMDDTPNYAEFLDAMFPGGASHPDPDNWDTILSSWSDQARMANIQCENCHGPNGQGSAHANMTATDSRISVSAGVCATCHGEPPRHGRYQQWLESGHANFQLAIDEGGSGGCNKCHTAQGFVAWSKMAIPFDVSTNPPGLPDASLAEPQTCATCHDPHNVGTISGNETNAPLRVMGDSPELLGGYTARGVGKGATCIICHNSRRGEAESVITSTPDRAPHGGVQGDLLMGQNAFYVTVGVRGPHSLITDTCANCHVSRTPPPAELSYNQSGTNHSFAANTSICGDCHGGFEPSQLAEIADSALEDLAVEIETAMIDEILFHTAAGREVEITGEVAGTPTTINITAAMTINSLELVESHGRQAFNIDVDGTLYEHVRTDSDTQIWDGGSGTGETLVDNTYTGNGGDVLRRVGWNYWLLHSDGSHSMHNPGWFQEILVATENALGTIRP